jgi:thioredoxin 1
MSSLATDAEIERIRQKNMSELIQKRNEVAMRQELGGDGKPVVLTDDTFETVKKYPFMLVDFWAAWCGPCRVISPIVEELAHEYQGSVWVGKLNVDENPVTADRFQVQSIPTLIMFKDGVPVDRIVGALPKHLIDSRLKAHLQSS